MTTALVEDDEPAGVRIIGRSPALLRVLETMTRVAGTDVSVLIRGESGTGRELVALLLHAYSPRSKQPLVVFDCVAIPAELAEAQLFEHVMQANGSTLFLDEIGELPLALQATLQRVLHVREVQPIGSSLVTNVDMRVIAATHRDLAVEVKAGRFREDLYCRLNGVEIAVPIGRELLDTAAAGTESGDSPGSNGGPTFREQIEAFERNLLRHTMQTSHGNQSETARRLQLNRATLYDKLKKYGMI